MQALRDVEQQLLSVVANAQLRLQSLSASSSSDCGAPADDVLASIERLQGQLRVITRSIAAKASEVVNSDKSEIKTVQLEAEEVVMSGSETETEGENDENNGGEGIQEDQNKENNDNRARLEKVQKQVDRFLTSVKQCANNPRKKFVNELFVRLKGGSIAMGKMFQFIRDGGIPDVETATKFRDAIVQLAGLLAPRKMDQKWVLDVTRTLRKIQVLATSNPKLPSALSDHQLLSVENALQTNRTRNKEGPLQKMEAFIRGIEAQHRTLEPEHIVVPLERLATDFLRDCRLYNPRQMSGKNPPRAEEGWKLFSNIGETLAQWLKLAAVVSPPPKMQGVLWKFERQLKSFANQYPGRVPDALLESSAILAKLAPKKPRSSKLKIQDTIPSQ